MPLCSANSWLQLNLQFWLNSNTLAFELGKSSDASRAAVTVIMPSWWVVWELQLMLLCRSERLSLELTESEQWIQFGGFFFLIYP